MTNALYNFLNKHWVTIITLFSFFAYVAAASFYSFNELTILYGDSRSRLLISRGIIDSFTPGLAQMGGVWPPMMQVLLLPTIWVDKFLYSGLSGTIVSVICATLGVYFLAKLTRSITNKFIPTVLATSVLALNPSYIYMATTPMSEVPFISFCIMSVYFLHQWLETKNVINIPLAAIGVILASLTRYEGFFLPIFGIFALVMVSALRKTDLKKIKGVAILYATPAFAGIIAWLLYNFIIFGNMFHFIEGETAHYSRAAGTGSGELTKGSVLNSFSAYLDGAILNIGIISVVIVAPVLLIALLPSRRKFIIPLFLFLAPIAFDILALFLGSADIYTLKNAGYLYNTRIGLFLLPAAALAYGAISSWRFSNLVLIPIFIFQLYLLFSTTPVTLLEAMNSAASDRGKAQRELSNWLLDTPIEGNTLISYNTNQTVVFDAKIPQRRVISESSGKHWSSALEYPEGIADRIIISPLGSDILWQKTKTSQHFLDQYSLTFKNSFFEVYDLSALASTKRIISENNLKLTSK